MGCLRFFASDNYILSLPPIVNFSLILQVFYPLSRQLNNMAITKTAYEIDCDIGSRIFIQTFAILSCYPADFYFTLYPRWSIELKRSGTLMTSLYKENAQSWDTCISVLTFPILHWVAL